MRNYVDCPVCKRRVLENVFPVMMAHSDKAGNNCQMGGQPFSGNVAA